MYILVKSLKDALAITYITYFIENANIFYNI